MKPATPVTKIVLFDRIVRDRPIPIPANGMHITQFGHVKDLAKAMCQVVGNEKAVGQIYNVSGDHFVTFDGLARACAVAAGKSPEDVKIVHYEPKKFDFGKNSELTATRYVCILASCLTP